MGLTHPQRQKADHDYVSHLLPLPNLKQVKQVCLLFVTDLASPQYLNHMYTHTHPHTHTHAHTLLPLAQMQAYITSNQRSE